MCWLGGITWWTDMMIRIGMVILYQDDDIIWHVEKNTWYDDMLDDNMICRYDMVWQNDEMLMWHGDLIWLYDIIWWDDDMTWWYNKNIAWWYGMIWNDDKIWRYDMTHSKQRWWHVMLIWYKMVSWEYCMALWWCDMTWYDQMLIW